MIRWGKGCAWALMLVLAGCAGYGAMSHAPAKFSDGMLVSQNGMTLYTFDKDSSGMSACYGKCAHNWPPFYTTSSSEGSGKFSVVTRNDGTKQWAYDGRPLYFFFKDKQPGDAKGDGLKGVWHVVKKGSEGGSSGMHY